VPGRIEQHAPPVRRRLFRSSSRSRPDRLSFGLVEVVHRKIKMDLLRRANVGPGRCLVVLHLYGDRSQTSSKPTGRVGLPPAYSINDPSATSRRS
jgi:hypothetical protein